MPNNGQYDKELSRQYPGLFVILLDQSVSMNQTDERSGQSKASLVTRHVNMIIQLIIEKAGIDEYTGFPKNYAYLCVLGYNDFVYPLLDPTRVPVNIPTLNEKSNRSVKNYRESRDPSGRVIKRIPERMRVWIEPKAEGNTDMTGAFEEAEIVVRDWLNSKPELAGQELGMQKPRRECFPPIVINITDAKHNGKDDPEAVADRIRRMGTDHGNTLIYNCHFTHEQRNPCIFPTTIEEVERSSRSKLAVRMFQMSSVMPEVLRTRAERIMNREISPGARCFVFNADPDTLLKFLIWGTLGNPAGTRGLPDPRGSGR